MNYPKNLKVNTLELGYKTSNFQLWPIGEQFPPNPRWPSVYHDNCVFEAKMSTVLQFLGNVITLPDEQEK